ncbi:MAG: sel1 repeat family protein [Rhodanobacteraceae bacterium]
MNIRIAAMICLLCMLSMFNLSGLAQDGMGLGSMSRGKVYDSDANADRPFPSFRSPEDDARPGQRFFHKGSVAYNRGDYRFAIDMYRVSASWAYSPSAYNLGLMYSEGDGVKIDLPRAMAWMTLAAQGGDAAYVHARERIGAKLSNEQLAQAETIFHRLEPDFGIQAISRRAKTRWLQVRRAATGSHAGFVGDISMGAFHASPNANLFGKGPTFIADMTSNTTTEGSKWYRQLWLSNNPYDSKFLQPTGEATVGPLILLDAKDATPSNKPDSPHNY